MVNKTVWEWRNLKSLWNSLIYLDEEHNRLFAGIIRLCIAYEGFLVIPTLAWKMCDKFFTPPFHFDYLLTQVPKSSHRSQYSESAKNICILFGGVRLPRTYLSKKKHPKDWSFLFEFVLKLELWNIKSQFSLKLFIFSGQDMKRCFLPFFGKQV